MIRIPKSVASFGAVALAAAALTLALPPTAHAVAALIVQLNNPITSPANTEDISKQANQLVHLTVDLQSDVVNDFNARTTNGLSPIAYVVPAGFSLVINTVDFTHQPDSAGLSFTAHLFGGTFSVMNFAVPSQPSLAQFGTVHLTYPSGLVIGPGFTPNIQMELNNGSGNDVVVDLFGYLTTN